MSQKVSVSEVSAYEVFSRREFDLKPTIYLKKLLGTWDFKCRAHSSVSSAELYLLSFVIQVVHK